MAATGSSVARATMASSSPSPSPLPRVLLPLFLLSAALPRALAYSWGVDGGSIYRTNSATVAVALTGGEEDTESMVEEVLLPSPLVTSFGGIVMAADNCTLMLYPDPAGLAAGALWQRSVANWDVPPALRGPNEESQFIGLALSNDVVFVLDGRNNAVHAVAVSINYFSWRWTSYLNISNGIKFDDGDTGMLPETATNLLWVPLGPNYAFPAAGMAATLDMTTGAVSYIPIPATLANDGCSKPYDSGSVAVDSGGVVLLSSDGEGTCGLVALDPAGLLRYNTFPDNKYLFNLGEHSHPLFDSATNNLYYLDFDLKIVDGVGQLLCCVNTNNQAYTNCWAVACVILPQFEVVDEKVDFVDYRWLWLAMGLQVRSGSASVLFVAASATENDETYLFGGLNDLTSAVFAFNTSSGELMAQNRFRADMFNSAPLVVTSSVDGTANVYISSSLGNIYCYSAAAIASGPLWIAQDLVTIPIPELPSTTYTFLSVTERGTLLATSTAGGATWQDQKATFAITNGLLSPSPASNDAAGAGASGPVAAGVSTAVILLGAMGAYFAYGRVAFFKGVVDSAIGKASSLTSSRAGTGVEKGGLLSEVKATGGGGSGYSSTL